MVPSRREHSLEVSQQPVRITCRARRTQHAQTQSPLRRHPPGGSSCGHGGQGWRQHISLGSMDSSHSHTDALPGCTTPPGAWVPGWLRQRRVHLLTQRPPGWCWPGPRHRRPRHQRPCFAPGAAEARVGQAGMRSAQGNRGLGAKFSTKISTWGGADEEQTHHNLIRETGGFPMDTWSHQGLEDNNPQDNSCGG